MIFIHKDIITDEAFAKIAVVSLKKAYCTYADYENALQLRIFKMVEAYIKFTKEQYGIDEEEYDENAVLTDLNTFFMNKLGVTIQGMDSGSIVSAVMSSPSFERVMSDVRDKFEAYLGKSKSFIEIATTEQLNKNYNGNGISYLIGKQIYNETDLFEFIECVSNYQIPNINFAQPED